MTDLEITSPTPPTPEAIMLDAWCRARFDAGLSNAAAIVVARIAYQLSLPPDPLQVVGA